MEPPHKRYKQSPRNVEEEDDFVPLGGDDENEEERAHQFGYDEANGAEDVDISAAPRWPRAIEQQRNARNDPRNAKDRPKSKHALPGRGTWILVKTKLHRRFVHNTATKESLWHMPQDVMPAVLEFERQEGLQKEKDANAKWAEEQLREMRGTGSNAVQVNDNARKRRRRSESLQREDEEAMMAELAAEAEKKEEEDVKQVVKNVEPLKAVLQQATGGGGGYDSDSSYEEVEVTDSEGEEDDGEQSRRIAQEDGEAAPQVSQDGPVEFGEDDIAYQLAAMNSDYDEDGDGAGSAAEEDDEYPEEQEALDNEEAANLFRDMLNDHNISPFTPWDKLISDESDSGIIMDDRYTILPNMRTRKEVWEAWVRDTASQLKQKRADVEKLDPKILYLAFLSENATPKLYWPEFKRKYRRENIMNDRNLGDKEREKLYREHIRRLKLPESTRKADLITLLKSVPLRDLNKNSHADESSLPQQIRSNLHFISLPASARDPIIAKHISTLPPAPADAGLDADEQQAEDVARRRREEALAERERQVGEQRRKTEKEERWAKKDLRDEERELRSAMEFSNRGLRAQLREK